MAVRPIFVASPEPPFVQKKTVGFGFAPGFAVSQARKNIAHLHESYMKAWHKTEPLEISSKSMQELGQFYEYQYIESYLYYSNI